MRSAFVGFDSAWGGKAKGGICAAVFEGDCLVDPPLPPEPASFDDAIDVIEQYRQDADYALVAVDQPTAVPNPTGMRSVEKVAASLTSVQPANLGGAMFCHAAPIWGFLDRLDANEEPLAARETDARGLHVIEVFPALALRALVGGAKRLHYNPERKKTFSQDDWSSVAKVAGNHAGQLNLAPLARWAKCQQQLTGPTKADQDCLDALICLILAMKWRRNDQDMEVLGDWRGHMVTPLSAHGRAKVEESAKAKGVPVGCGSWQLHDAVLRYFDGKHYDAFEWLGHPSAALGGETPLARASEPDGTQDVLDLLGRMAHGIPT